MLLPTRRSSKKIPGRSCKKSCHNYSANAKKRTIARTLQSERHTATHGTHATLRIRNRYGGPQGTIARTLQSELQRERYKANHSANATKLTVARTLQITTTHGTHAAARRCTTHFSLPRTTCIDQVCVQPARRPIAPDYIARPPRSTANAMHTAEKRATIYHANYTRQWQQRSRKDCQSRDSDYIANCTRPAQSHHSYSSEVSSNTAARTLPSSRASSTGSGSGSFIGAEAEELEAEELEGAGSD